MSNNEFGQIVAIDFAPREGLCEWCGEPAVQQLITIAGTYHNKSGFFCRACSEAFICVGDSSAGKASVSEREKTRSTSAAEEKYGSNRLPLGQAYEKWSEQSNQDIPVPLD